MSTCGPRMGGAPSGSLPASRSAAASSAGGGPKAEVHLHRPDLEPVAGLKRCADIRGKRRAVDLRAPAAAEVFDGAHPALVPIEPAVAAGNLRDV